ncbi:serine/threonine protein kinase [Fulvivirga imtechensis AK7]|uniref:Serine/threonine protein kinase n=1 Tax=Fulvivirga imtechensis AK7 TaxID=1237149 RepID=L8JU76_9BACT|nr:transporter substrate-binding domain-containing protein [Fulvivirga imtechensis]ELR72325.1 serine/threonine protein kinase [Fulvivirga imtechensis AK7]
MKTKVLTFFFGVSAVFLGFLCSPLHAQYSGDTWQKAGSSGSGMISLAYVETPGFVYKDNAGNLTGICVDIMRDFVSYVGEKKGVKLSVQFVGDGSSFGGMYNNVKGSQGGVFGLGNITITPARKKEIKFSPPFITNFAILVTQNSVPTLNSLNEISKTFAGLTAYTAKGTLNDKRLADLKSKYYPDMKVAYASSSPETLEKVLSDPKSFSYLDLAFYLDAVQRRQPLKRHPVGDQSSEQFGFIMPMNSDWQPLMEEFFAADGGYTNSMAYKKILSKHLGDTGVKLLQTKR